MELALIPPYSLLEYTRQTRFQLMLPQCLRNEAYAEEYLDHCRNPEKFVILDNGAAEDEEWSIEQLLVMASQFPVNEIVVPDIMRSSVGTLDLLQRAEDTIVRHTWVAEKGIQFMAVAQGHTYTELADFIRIVDRDFPFVGTIGLPRHLLTTIGSGFIRSHLARLVSAEYPRLQVHFLGANPVYPKELKYLAKQKLRNARSLDTSMPFVFAYHDHHVDLAASATRMRRPPNYFTVHKENFTDGLVAENVKVMLEWADGR